MPQLSLLFFCNSRDLPDILILSETKLSSKGCNNRGQIDLKYTKDYIFGH